jgi:hypothetical protein
VLRIRKDTPRILRIRSAAGWDASASRRVSYLCTLP